LERSVESDLFCLNLLQPAKTLGFLYKDVQSLTSQPRLVDLSSPSTDKVISALADMSVFLPATIQRKVLFYGAYWLRLTTTEKQHTTMQVEEEVKRLEAEVERAEDEERFRAANEAIQQHTVHLSSSNQ
jgi:hypothetical protein